jgi:hypothetical protein
MEIMEIPGEEGGIDEELSRKKRFLTTTWAAW